jgi:hypothetical protein
MKPFDCDISFTANNNQSFASIAVDFSDGTTASINCSLQTEGLLT